MGKVKEWIKDHKVEIAAVAAGTLGLIVGGVIVQKKYPSDYSWVGFANKKEADFISNIVKFDGGFLYDNLDGIAIKDMGELGERLLENVGELTPDSRMTDFIGYNTTKRRVPTVL